jgi:hypothetical protein
MATIIMKQGVIGAKTLAITAARVGRRISRIIPSKQPRRKRQIAMPVKLVQAAVIMRMAPHAILAKCQCAK